VNKIILHCDNLDNLILMARAARNCVEMALDEGDWKVFHYGEGQLPHPVCITAIKRKSCITIYEQQRGEG
jgi:hypothetical protein